MIIVHHLNQSRSDRIVWLLEELGLPYEMRTYLRNAAGLADADYRALHPMGTSPILTDGDLTLVETGGIIEYVLDRYGDGRLVPPRGTREYALYLQWIHFAEGGAAFSILTEAILAVASAGRDKPNPFLRVWRDRNERMMPWLNDELGRRAYFCGDAFTAADIAMAYDVSMFERFIPRPLADFPNIVSYRDKVFARPAYVKTMQRLYPQGRPATWKG